MTRKKLAVLAVACGLLCGEPAVVAPPASVATRTVMAPRGTEASHNATALDMARR
jgi:hypothetical protein